MGSPNKKECNVPNLRKRVFVGCAAVAGLGIVAITGGEVALGIVLGVVSGLVAAANHMLP